VVVPTFSMPAMETRRTAHEYVRDALRDAILDGTLSAGTRLVQAELARRLRVSTTPVREALRDLATEGLVRIDAHRGAVVSTLSAHDFEEIHELCRILEPQAMRTADPERFPAAIATAERLVDAMDRESDPSRWTALNRQFHAAVLGTTSSARLRALLLGLYDAHGPYIAVDMRDRGAPHFEAANRQHRAMVDALRDADLERSAALALEHLDATKTTLHAIQDLVEGGRLHGADQDHDPVTR
jgi:DNA-binding GntR family transcriptional regulator